MYSRVKHLLPSLCVCRQTMMMSHIAVKLVTCICKCESVAVCVPYHPIPSYRVLSGFHCSMLHIHFVIVKSYKHSFLVFLIFYACSPTPNILDLSRSNREWNCPLVHIHTCRVERVGRSSLVHKHIWISTYTFAKVSCFSQSCMIVSCLMAKRGELSSVLHKDVHVTMILNYLLLFVCCLCLDHSNEKGDCPLVHINLRIFQEFFSYNIKCWKHSSNIICLELKFWIKCMAVQINLVCK